MTFGPSNVLHHNTPISGLELIYLPHTRVPLYLIPLSGTKMNVAGSNKIQNLNSSYYKTQGMEK